LLVLVTDCPWGCPQTCCRCLASFWSGE